RRLLQRRYELGRNVAENLARGAARASTQVLPQQRTRRWIGVNKASGSVNGYDTTADVAQDVLGLQSHLDQFGRQLFTTSAGLAQSRGDISRTQCDASEHQELQPVSESQR